MPIAEPVFFDQDGQAFGCAVIRIKADLREGRKLTGAIPSVGAMYEDVGIVQVNRSNDDQYSVQNVGQMRQPVSLTQSMAVQVAGDFTIA